MILCDFCVRYTLVLKEAGINKLLISNLKHYKLYFNYFNQHYNLVKVLAN